MEESREGEGMRKQVSEKMIAGYQASLVGTSDLYKELSIRLKTNLDNRVLKMRDKTSKAMQRLQSVIESLENSKYYQKVKCETFGVSVNNPKDLLVEIPSNDHSPPRSMS